MHCLQFASKSQYPSVQKCQSLIVQDLAIPISSFLESTDEELAADVSTSTNADIETGMTRVLNCPACITLTSLTSCLQISNLLFLCKRAFAIACRRAHAQAEVMKAATSFTNSVLTGANFAASWIADEARSPSQRQRWVIYMIPRWESTFPPRQFSFI